MVQVGRIHKRIDRCVPGGDRILPESGPEVSDRVLPESGPGCPTGYCQKVDRGIRQGFRQEKVLILFETIPGENPKPVMYSQILLFKSK